MSLHYDEKGKYFTQYVSKETVRALIQTTTNRIEGLIYVRVGERVSDFLNNNEAFLAVTDAKVYDLSGNLLHEFGFFAVNQHQVVWLAPIEDDLNQDEPAETEP